MLILSSNKPLPLIIPVKKGRSKTQARRVEIDHSTRWQRVHKASLESAYRSAPYFDHYFEHFIPFFNDPHPLLFDLNLKVTQKVFQLLQWNPEKLLLLSELNKIPENIADFRGAIRPKKNTGQHLPGIQDVPYPQVFSDRFGFIPGLSILDLLFNTGPEASQILCQMAQN